MSKFPGRQLVHRSRTASASRHLALSFLEAALLEPPQQKLNAVLSEKRLTFEDHCGNAPVAGFGMGVLRTLDDRFVFLGRFRDPAVELREIAACTFRGARELIR